MTYYKTTDLTHEQLVQKQHRAGSQEDIIKIFFNKHPERKFTASEVWQDLQKSGAINHHVPLTSIRRAISSLKKEGWIDRLPDTKIGLYKDPEHYYQLTKKWAPAGYAEHHPVQI